MKSEKAEESLGWVLVLDLKDIAIHLLRSNEFLNISSCVLFRYVVICLIDSCLV